MKTLDLMHKHGTPKTGNIYNREYVFNPEQIESLINEVIAQRAGEPVEVRRCDPDKHKWKNVVPVGSVCKICGETCPF